MWRSVEGPKRTYGEHYYALHGSPLVHVPERCIERPSPEFVRWHNENRFLG
jgi:putative restriction endonuclease